MKKYIQLFVVLVLALTVIGVARNNPAWASSLLTSDQPSGAAQPLSKITITESGSYTIGGLCQFNVVYTGSGASADVAVDVPAEISRKVPFSYEGVLYLAGCHIVHYTLDMATGKNKVIREMSPAYGSWEVCFGDRPDEQLTIYYYLDDPETGSAVWQPLITTVKDGFICAPANYTGVYAPGGKSLNADTNAGTGAGVRQNVSTGGTVRPPAPVKTGEISKSGTYNIGGVCSIIIEYYIPNQLTEVHVEENIEISANVPFPDNEGLLYLPGCHVFHYVKDVLVTDVTKDEGSWKICFASIPNKETTIYFYYAKDEAPESALPDWAPLETTIESGLACAPLANQTGVYAPVGK
jgi:hypothetical protein